eukprot:1080223-Amphidinium_carterae.2
MPEHARDERNPLDHVPAVFSCCSPNATRAPPNRQCTLVFELVNAVLFHATITSSMRCVISSSATRVMPTQVNHVATSVILQMLPDRSSATALHLQ